MYRIKKRLFLEFFPQINISVTSYGADGNWFILQHVPLFSNYKQHGNRTESSKTGNQRREQPDTRPAAKRKACPLARRISK